MASCPIFLLASSLDNHVFFKIRNDILAVPPKLVFTPRSKTILTYLKLMHCVPADANSVVISVTAVIIAVIFSFLAAYCFSRFQPKVTNFLMFLLLSIRMLPDLLLFYQFSDVRCIWMRQSFSNDHVLRYVLNPFSVGF